MSIMLPRPGCQSVHRQYLSRGRCRFIKHGSENLLTVDKTRIALSGLQVVSFYVCWREASTYTVYVALGEHD